MGIISGLVVFNLALAILFGAPAVYGCAIDGPKSIDWAVSTKDQRATPSDSEGNLLPRGALTIGNCTRMRLPFLQITRGAIIHHIHNATRAVAVNPGYIPSECRIDGLPYASAMSQDLIALEFEKKRKYLVDCMQYKIVSEDGPPNFPPQPSCKMTKVDDKTYIVDGGVCYIGAPQGLNLDFEIEIKKQCLAEQYFSSTQTHLQSIEGELAFSATQTSDGSGAGFAHLKVVPMRVIHAPYPEQMPVSEPDFLDGPVYPAIWVMPRIEAGRIMVTANGDQRSVKMEFIVDNRCKATCVRGVCSSPCSYDTPVFAEMELFRLGGSSGSKKELVGSWYSGSPAQGHWQGIVRGEFGYFHKEEVPAGDYEIVATFRDPKLDYEFFKEQFESSIGGIPIISGRIEGDLGEIYKPSLPSLPPFPSMGDLDGSTEVITDGAKTLDPSVFEKAAVKFNKASGISLAWPPHMEKVCNNAMTHCKKPDIKANLRLSASFRLGEETDDGYGNLRVTNVTTKKTSPLLASETRSLGAAFPEVVCE